MRGMARQIEEDGADGTAILRAIIDAREHQHGPDRGHGVGQRQENGDRGQHAHARHDADDIPDDHPGKAVEEIVPLERDAEALQQIVQTRYRHFNPS